MENNALGKMCNKIVDVIYETVNRKCYFVKISQSKKGHVCLIVRRKMVRRKISYIKRSLTFPAACFIGAAKGMTFCIKNTFTIGS